MQTQKNVMLAFIAVLTVILVWLICNHIQEMKQMEVRIEEIRNREHLINEKAIAKKSMW